MFGCINYFFKNKPCFSDSERLFSLRKYPVATNTLSQTTNVIDN